MKKTPASQQVREHLSVEIKRLEKRLVPGEVVTPISNISTEQQLRERENVFTPLIGDDKDNEESIDEQISRQKVLLSMLRMQIRRNATSSDGRTFKTILGPLCTRSCPTIHEEFLKAERCPDGIDNSLAHKALYRGYLDAQSHPWLSSMLIREGSFSSSPAQLLKRWGGNCALSEMQSRGVLQREIIDCRPLRRVAGIEYDARILSSFANNPNRAHLLVFGSTHVSIGFNDLGYLLSAKFQESTDFPQRKGCFRFVGYEMSEFSVAKFSVIAHMMRDSDAPLLHLVQVWYSSTWSQGALESFRRSVSSVLNSSPDPLSDSERKIHSYLKNWMTVEPVSAASARQRWLDKILRNSSGNHIFDTCSFRHKQDRLALSKHFLTGELIPSEKDMRMHVVELSESEDSNSLARGNELSLNSADSSGTCEGLTKVSLASKEGENQTDPSIDETAKKATKKQPARSKGHRQTLKKRDAP